MQFNENLFNYSSRRSLVYAKNGMVATSSHLAAQAGLDILKQGGNAIDAAIATAAALTVVEPTSNGIGGDCFSIVYHNDEIFGLNASGRSPKLMTPEAIKKLGDATSITRFGLTPVTVPGIPSGWKALSEKFGKLKLIDVLMPAIKIAETGFPVSPSVAIFWKKYFDLFSSQVNEYPVLKYWFKTYCPLGRAPEIGEIVYLPDHAKTLRLLGESNGEAFYSGIIAEAIDSLSKKYSGFIRKEDLKKHKVEWVKPISTSYRGYDIWELPPNGIGMIALMAFNILENFDLKSMPLLNQYHHKIEALKLAFIDGLKYIGDPGFKKINLDVLLSKKYSKLRAALIQETALLPEAGKLEASGTVYLATADNEGNMVSFIQSCYTGFGSGAVVPGYGISLHNRGNQFSLEKGHPNYLEPEKRPFHTIIPGFMTKAGKAIGPFGIMGGPLQPQAHLQVISNIIDLNFNPQDALNAPRWQWVAEKKVQFEAMTPLNIIEGLRAKGHEVEIISDHLVFGRGQIIIRLENGVLVGATEPRTDGGIASF